MISGAGGLTLGAGAETLSGANTLTLTDAVGAFSGVISGGGGLSLVAGVETLLADTYTGATKVYGTLDLGAGGLIVGSSNVSLKASGAVFDVSAAGQGVAAVSIVELTGVTGTAANLGSARLAINEPIAASFSGAIH